jgi:hypothetical protein
LEGDDVDGVWGAAAAVGESGVAVDGAATKVELPFWVWRESSRLRLVVFWIEISRLNSLIASYIQKET